MKTYLSLLKKFVSTKSISTDTSFVPEINRTVGWLKKTFTQNGFKVKVTKGYQNPIIIAEYRVSEKAETCIIYGHYDVQPASKEDGWHQDPFELLVGDERLYARGVVDNKGQVLVHIATVFDLIKEKKLKYNVKFLLEGDEETGSPKLEQFINDRKKELEADIALISDGETTQGRPVIEAGFRGGMNATLTFTSSHTDLHSGIYGGAAPNSLHEMTKFLADLFGENYEVKLPGFYDNVDEIPEKTRKANENIPLDEVEYKKITGTKTMLLAEGHDFYSAVGLQPSVQLTGIQSGYTGTGYRNSIPARTIVKINFRFVLSQDPERIKQRFNEYLDDHVPEYIDFEFEVNDPYDGVKLNLDSRQVKDIAKLLKKAYGVEPIYKFAGGGLPIVTYFKENLKIDPILVPLANEDCNMHAVNENYNIDELQKALKFSRLFFIAT
ncbi:MAG: M20/M25/M40 family metallo-hydrolase [Candidatus Dojkabacteria bacterium]